MTPPPVDSRHPDEALLAGLNAEQRAAVTAPPDRHALVLAGAGCGKTTVLTRRIAYLLRSYAAESLLALTFTRKAAEEMTSRLAALIAEGGHGPAPLTTTFHGFGLRVVRDRTNGIAHAARLGYTSEPRLLEGNERLAILARVTTAHEREALGMDLMRIEKLLDQRSVHPAKLADLSEDRRRLVDEIARRVSEVKMQQGVWEFADMINAAMDLFRGHPDVAQHYAARYRVVLVDEFQDTNPLQVEMLRVLLSGGAALFAVGDDDQAIYGFRGADTGPTLRFTEFFHNAHILKLQTNYRSTPVILTTANRIFRDKDPAYRKVLVSGRYRARGPEGGRRPRTVVCKDQKAMTVWIACELLRLNRRDKITPRMTTLLFRTNETLETTQSLLEPLLSPDGEQPQFVTIHSSKGLEFPVVFLCDLEESVFPSYRSRRKPSTLDSLRRFLARKPYVPDDCDIEEELRLFYVGVTRAQKLLYFLSARSKAHFNRTIRYEPSRFLGIV